MQLNQYKRNFKIGSPHPSQNLKAQRMGRRVLPNAEILPLERCCAESLELDSIDPLLSALLSLYQYVVKLVHSLDDCCLNKSWPINFGIGSVVQGKSMSAIEGLIESHDYARVADLGRVHETVVAWRTNVAEHPVFPDKGWVFVHQLSQRASHNHAFIVDAGGQRYIRSRN